MITFKQFISESHARFTPLQQFFIMCWGKLLYLDYEHLPDGPDTSTKYANEFKKIMSRYHTLDDDELVEEDEWIGEGGRMKDGTALFTRKTVDAVLSSAQHKAGKKMTLHRFMHNADKLRPNSWISMTTLDHGYPGDRTEYQIEPDDLIIDAHGLADDHEVIVNTNVLLGKK